VDHRRVTTPRVRLSPLLQLPFLLLASGCPSIDLGLAPFFCNGGNPICPEGYSCQAVGKQQVCVKDEGQLGSLDGSKRPVDGAVKKDRRSADRGGSPGSEATVVHDGPITPKPDGPSPAAGQIQITEMMFNPKAVADTDGEWLELHNVGSQTVDLSGWTLKDLGSDTHVIKSTGSLLVPPQAYFVLGRSSATMTNGGVKVDYVYSSFSLANTADEVVLLDSSGKTVVSVSYSTTSGWTIPDGSSLSRPNASSDPNLSTSWCTETKTWAGSAGDNGTPGAPSGC
jgi:hypothetical protein